MKRTGNLVLTALLALLGFVILVESNDNKLDIKIADKENLDVKNIYKINKNKNIIFKLKFLSQVFKLCFLFVNNY